MRAPVILTLAAILSSVANADRAPHGRVGLEGRALADGAGPFNALGTTLFWALWGERHDPDRLDKNLSWMAGRGVDYVRFLGMVGGGSWSDRVIDPASKDYWPAVDRLLDRVASHGLRAQVTLFAEADDMMPSRAARELFVDRWADKANAHPERFVMLEIANEHAQNGLGDIAELRTLGSRLARRTDVLVALSSPPSGKECEVYAGSDADLATIHYGRGADGQEGLWAPVRQPWSWPQAFDRGCRGRLPAAVNNEPIGPQSSVAGDDDPRRLAMAYILTFVAGNSAYVLHTGAGVRGGGVGDHSRRRPANLFEVAKIDQTLTAIAAAQRYLPPGLANWGRLEPSGADFPFGTIDGSALTGVYGSANGDQFVLAILGTAGPVTLQARAAFELELRHVLTGTVRARHQVRKGETFNLEDADSYVVIGRRASAG